MNHTLSVVRLALTGHHRMHHREGRYRMYREGRYRMYRSTRLACCVVLSCKASLSALCSCVRLA